MARYIASVKKASSFSLTLALIGIGVVGLSLSMWLTKDTRWMQWHLSRLGEGNEFSSAIFNYSLILAAMVLAALAIRLTDEIRTRDPRRSVTFLRNMMLGAAAAWVGVAIFPFDRFPLIHNIFGYSQMLIICILMLTLKRLTTSFSARTHTIGLIAVLVSGALMTLHHLVHVPSLLLVELVGQVALFAWLISMTTDQRQ